jgi:hypothetical protein
LAVAGPGAPAALAATVGTPAITVAGGNSVIAARNAVNGLYFFWNQYGTDNWQAETVAGAGTTFSSPSISVSANTVIIAAQGPDDSLDFYWQADGSPTWHPEVVPNGTAFSQPALATWSYWAWNRAGEIYGVSIVAQGTGLTANEFSAVDGSSVWDPAPVGTCGFCDFFATSSPVTAVYNNEDLNVAATAPDQANVEMFWQVSSTDPDGYVPPWGPFNEELAGSISS